MNANPVIHGLLLYSLAGEPFMQLCAHGFRLAQH